MPCAAGSIDNGSKPRGVNNAVSSFCCSSGASTSGVAMKQVLKRSSISGTSQRLIAPPYNAAAVAIGVARGNQQHNQNVHNWQATKHCLKERFSFMFNNEVLADVHFLVGRGEQQQVQTVSYGFVST